MEFVQLHPTTLYGTNILISEAARGEGGFLVNREGERFMVRYAPSSADLAPRDVVARAIEREIAAGRGFEGGYVHLDLRHLGEGLIRERLQGIRQIAIEFAGLDPIGQPIPVQPGQHYSMGGIDVDIRGATDLPGLYAAGEAQEELFLGSPFDYENSTLLYLAKDVPEPNAHGYQQAVDRALIHLCKATGGRTLVLFTSYAQLKRTSQNITGPLADDGILVYEQGEGASPNTLLDAFKTTDRAVLLGTRSFWEGVDIPGEQLSVVVLVKLPFDVPSDPLIAARSETFENPFNEYQLPEAILKFRQGFGRLIRTASDRGVVVVLDRRLLTKTYGRLFIKSLPQCTLEQGNLADLPKQAAKWLNL